jgi:hypothetical protein
MSDLSVEAPLVPLPVDNVQAVSEPESQVQSVLEALSLEQGNLIDDQFTQLVQLVRSNTDLFALEESELGHTDIIKHSVDTGDQHPIRQPGSRVPFMYRETIAAMVNEIEEQGVVCPSCSPWASPVVLVPKKVCIKRFCVDYRKLNGITKKDG